MNGKDIGEPASWILALIAMIFSIGKIWRVLDPQFYVSPYFTGILIGFLAHELAHRGVARKYGLYSQFYASPWGLLITFATGFIPGIIILAPGYVGVYAWGPTSRKGWIRSVESGPLTNVVLAVIFTVSGIIAANWLRHYMLIIAGINAWIAFFNLLPIPPLDGAKILRADPTIWGILIAVSII